MPTPEEAALIARLTADGRYRVLERFTRREAYHAPDGTATRWALYVDVETTGLRPADDRIIQLAAVPFEYDPGTGRLFRVEPASTWFEDPGRPIPADVTALTGITDTMVAGQHIDDAAVEALLDRVGLVVAHNAAFDRAFLERRLPRLERAHWACTRQDIPWDAEGLSSRSLEWLAYKQCALFHDAHRADEDCHLGVHLLSTVLPSSGTLAMQALLVAARTRTVRFWALTAPFDAKDALKARGYRWSGGEDGRPKCWYRDVPEPDAATERQWLANAVYGGRDDVARATPFGAQLRHSPRLDRLGAAG